VKSCSLTAVLVLILGACVLAQNATPPVTTVTPNGYIRTENGVFSQVDDSLCSYSSRAGNTERRVRQCYTLANGEWKPTKPTAPPHTAVPGPGEYLDFAPCDPLNQLNIAVQHTDIAALLPRSAMLKQVVETKQVAVAVYSDSPNQKVRYPLRLALLLRRSGGWSRGNDVSVGADGNFCGMRLMPQENGAVALVYLDEPAGSSDFAAIQSFRLSWPR